jgi:hypothetical protein
LRGFTFSNPYGDLDVAGDDWMTHDTGVRQPMTDTRFGQRSAAAAGPDGAISWVRARRLQQGERTL